MSSREDAYQLGGSVSPCFLSPHKYLSGSHLCHVLAAIAHWHNDVNALGVAQLRLHNIAAKLWRGHLTADSL